MPQNVVHRDLAAYREALKPIIANQIVAAYPYSLKVEREREREREREQGAYQEMSTGKLWAYCICSRTWSVAAILGSRLSRKKAVIHIYHSCRHRHGDQLHRYSSKLRRV